MKKQKAEPGRRSRRIAREIGYYAILIAAILLFRSVVAENYVIPSGSMEPTLKVGDYLFASKCSYGLRIPFTEKKLVEWGGVRRGDIVIFPSVAGPRPWFFGIQKTDKLIKRVIGLPGETLRVRDNRVYIDGIPLERRLAEHHEGLYDLDDANQKTLYVETVRRDLAHYIFQINGQRMAARTWPEVQVQEGHVFVMGDNRDQSNDSRYFGQIEVDSILGKAGVIYMSLDKTKFPWRIRYERLGRIVR